MVACSALELDLLAFTLSGCFRSYSLTVPLPTSTLPLPFFDVMPPMFMAHIAFLHTVTHALTLKQALPASYSALLHTVPPHASARRQATPLDPRLLQDRPGNLPFVVALQVESVLAKATILTKNTDCFPYFSKRSIER